MIHIKILKINIALKRNILHFTAYYAAMTQLYTIRYA